MWTCYGVNRGNKGAAWAKPAISDKYHKGNTATAKFNQIYADNVQTAVIYKGNTVSGTWNIGHRFRNEWM